MEFICFVIGVMALGWVTDAFSDSSNDTSEGYYDLHNEADKHASHIAGRNCENCRWYTGNSCRWQENCYAPASKYHEYCCNNYEPK